MRNIFAEPSHHPAAWVVLVFGCLSLVLVAMTSAPGIMGLVGWMMSASITAMGLAELLPVGLKPLTIALRILSLTLAVATLVLATGALIF